VAVPKAALFDFVEKPSKSDQNHIGISSVSVGYFNRNESLRQKTDWLKNNFIRL